MCEFNIPVIFNTRKSAKSDSTCGNAFNISKLLSNVFLPLKRHLEAAYAAGMAQVIATKIVPTLNNNEFFSHNTFLDYDCYV